MAKKKYYVVWKGVTPGIYSSWEECQVQIAGVQALYKSFNSLEEAERALPVQPMVQKPVDRKPVAPSTPADVKVQTPILEEEQPKQKEKIDKKKLIVYSEIMKPKYME